jgi:hypothetical protein
MVPESYSDQPTPSFCSRIQLRVEESKLVGVMRRASMTPGTNVVAWPVSVNVLLLNPVPNVTEGPAAEGGLTDGGGRTSIEPLNSAKNFFGTPTHCPDCASYRIDTVIAVPHARHAPGG